MPSSRSASTAWLTHSVSGLSFVQQQAELVAALAGVLELADDHAVVELGRGDEEGGRQVDDDRVHLAVLQRELGVVVAVEHHRVGVGGDDLGQHVEARGADLGADPQALEVGEVVAPSAAEPAGGDHGLADRVVRRGEVDRLLALLGDGELVDVEVERPGAGLDGGVERHAGPGDLVLGVAQLRGDGVGDRGLEALAALRRRRRRPRARRPARRWRSSGCPARGSRVRRASRPRRRPGCRRRRCRRSPAGRRRRPRAVVAASTARGSGRRRIGGSPRESVLEHRTAPDPRARCSPWDHGQARRNR